MPDKQDRYRKRKTEQGFQRVEVLVPDALTAHLKSYARALRDAHALGLDPPLFDGMKRATSASADLSSSTSAQPAELPASKPVASARPAAQPARSATVKSKQRPDFSKGLLDE